MTIFGCVRIKLLYFNKLKWINDKEDRLKSSIMVCDVGQSKM